LSQRVTKYGLISIGNQNTQRFHKLLNLHGGGTLIIPVVMKNR